MLVLCKACSSPVASARGSGMSRVSLSFAPTSLFRNAHPLLFSRRSDGQRSLGSAILRLPFSSIQSGVNSSHGNPKLSTERRSVLRSLHSNDGLYFGRFPHARGNAV